MSNHKPAHRLCAAAAGILFQYPGLLIAALVGAGAANVLKHPAPWLHGLTSGARTLYPQTRVGCTRMCSSPRRPGCTA